MFPCSCGEGDRANEPVPPLRVGWFLWTGWFPIILARDLGYFERRQVQIEPILYDSYTQLLPDFSSGKIDATFAGLYELLKSNIPNFKVILVSDHSDGAEGLMVVPDIQTPADLKGKRIGIQGALSGSEFIVVTLLRRHGLTRNDLTLVDVDAERVIEAMPETIRGGYTWEPFIGQGKKKGYRLLFSTADTPGMVPDVLAVHERLVTTRAKELQAFVDAWFEALTFWQAQPDQALRIIAKATGLQPQDIDTAGCRLATAKDNRRLFSKEDPESLETVGREQINFFLSMGDASSVPVVEKVLEPRFIMHSSEQQR